MKILVSACLLGLDCKYTGENNLCPRVAALREGHTLIPVCPEQLGGLPTPRPPAERIGEQVRTREGRDVTAAYQRGAEEVLRLARRFGCKKALLKERSPSCGHGKIYDGSFSGILVPGSGVAAQWLAAHGLEIFGESQWEALL